MTKAHALAVLSDVVDAHNGALNAMDEEERKIADEASEALALLAKDWHATNCPLCDAPLDHIQQADTHIYKCDACPFIGFEYYRDTDTDNLKASIK